jgi:hypothetical protein
LVREFGRSASAGVVLPLAVGLSDAIRGHARRAGGADHTALLRLGAQVAIFVGWMAQEAGDDQAATRWSDLAVDLAGPGGDAAVRDYVRVRKALVALYRGDAGRVVALAAATRAQPDADPRIRRLASLREAQGHALAGDERRCMAALEAAERLGPGAGPPSGDAWFGSASVSDMSELVTGWCLYDLGRTAQAEVSLAAGLRHVPAGAYRARARFATRQALAQAASRELDQACDTMTQAVPEIIRTDSATIRADVVAFSREIARWRGHGAVRALQPVITEILLRTPGVESSVGP